MTPPFVIFALPRSRTAWLAHWLAHVSGARVGHDLAIDANTIDHWLEAVARTYRGTCETGAVEIWPILRRSVPNCRIITIHRPLKDVCASLAAAGYTPPLETLTRRYAALERLAEEDGVLSVPFGALVDPKWCAMVQEYALGQPFNWSAWREADEINIQVEYSTRIQRLAERRPALDKLKAELAERLAEHKPFISVGEEPWASVAEDVERMGVSHHAEATEAIAGDYRLDQKTLLDLAAASLWRVFVARIDGVFAGYCCWMKETNLEEAAPPTMNHGPFYASPCFARHRLGVKLLNVSRAVLEAEGYKILRLHHTTRGRGAKAGALYEQLGAVEYQREYIWKVGNNA